MGSFPEAIGAGALVFFMSAIGFSLLVVAGKGEFTPQMTQGIIAISSIIGFAVGYSVLSDSEH